MKEGKIIGWRFRRGHEASYNADGQSTLDTLNEEKKRLEARLIQIPRLVAGNTHRISLIQSDVTWLSGLSRSAKRKWEKDNGKTTEEAIYRGNNTIASLKATNQSLKLEQSRIPEQIEAIDTQLEALVKGESKGLEKGLDKETAKELGEIEIQKERDKMEFEREVRQKAIEEEQKQEAKKQQSKKALFIGIGVFILIAILGYVAYRQKMANAKLIA